MLDCEKFMLLGFFCGKAVEFPLIESLNIHGFKKFSHLNLNDLSRVNIFIGDNNVGKTIALEAIFAFSCGLRFPPMLFVSILGRLQNGISSNQNFWNPYSISEAILNIFNVESISDMQNLRFSFDGVINGQKCVVSHCFSPGKLFAEFMPERSLTWYNEPVPFSNFEIKDSSGKPVRLSVSEQLLGKWETKLNGVQNVNESFSITFPHLPNDLQNEPLLLTKMHDLLSHRDELENRRIFSALKRSGVMDDFVENINNSFNIKIDAIESIPFPDGSESPIAVRLKNKSYFAPMYTLGDGLRRWYALLGEMLVFQNAVHCIEEIDVCFHHEAQADLSKQLVKYAQKYNNQLFITTHNIEYLDTFLYAINDMDVNILKTDVRVITLRSTNDCIRNRVLNGVEALQARIDGLEIRI